MGGFGNHAQDGCDWGAADLDQGDEPPPDIYFHAYKIPIR
jgi:hypothetical protein